MTLPVTSSPIPQVDGTSEKDIDFEETLCPQCYEIDIYFETDRGFSKHMFEDHEPNDVAEDFGNEWIKDNAKYMNRNTRNKSKNVLSEA